MARGFSKAIIIGNITRDPEMRAITSGAQVCSFSVAVNRNYKGQDGSDKEQVSFINCTAWGKAAEIICQYAHRGSGIMVCGRLEQRSFEGKDGVKRSSTEIVVEDFNFIGGRGEAGDGGSDSVKASDDGASEEVVPDDIPEEPIDLSDVPF
ncbi:single-stranded DNA-binding protein [Candidatus Saccharibacteria bacterium]|nr:single-stranded DNA-binding protein [Candidatus Saccharibacteria bacterium]